MANQTIPVRVICVDPPVAYPGYDAIQFGIQDKHKQVLTGDALSPDQRQYEFDLTVKQHDDGTPNFTGPFAHGSRVDRFLYLSLMGQQDGSWIIIQRIKIPLKTITWTQVQSVLDDASQLLCVKVRGDRTGTVPLLDDGWTVLKV